MLPNSFSLRLLSSNVARHVVAWIESAPGAVEIDFDPGAEIHGIDHRHAEVAEMAVDVARGYVEAATEGDREMGEVAADPDALVERVIR